MKILIVLGMPFLLSGCAIDIAHNTQMSVFCYRDYGAVLPNGMYVDNQLNIRCNGGRHAVMIEHRMGEPAPHIMDFSKHD